MKKKTVVFDFDGVIHKYSKGWQDGSIYDVPNEGIKETIEKLRQNNYEVVIVSTRCSTEEGRQAIMNYLFNYGIVVDKVCKEKPPAIVYIDDRAICYDPKMTTLYECITNFKTNQQIEKEYKDMSREEQELNYKSLTFSIEKGIEALKNKYNIEENLDIILKIQKEWIEAIEKYL